MGHVLLPNVESEKDLGVTISKNLDFVEYVYSCINKANAMIAWVNRTFVSREKDLMLKIYKSMIRPHLEYCVQLWSPLPAHGNWKLILAIEDVQRNFTRQIDNVGLLPYKTRLDILGLTTLIERRARGDLIETFKIVNNISDYGQNLFRFSRSGEKLVSRPGDEHRIKHSIFARRVINYWNKLPSHVKFSKSVDSFKNNLLRFKSNNCQNGNYWELSNEIFNRISDSNREAYTTFVSNNPLFARRRNINIRVTMV